MIVWLASYPRSGNTLLRTVFQQTMGLGSFSDEIMQPSVGHTDFAKQSYGHIDYEGPWDSFYHEAITSKEVFLIKTHLPPCDNQPAIYVIRDGRAATDSYASYHSNFSHNLNAPSSILELMLGNDYYGDWTSHYRAWNTSDNRKLLLVKFDDLVNANAIMLEKLKFFIGFDGIVKPFENPLVKLQNENPNFFRSGNTKWSSSNQWTEKLENFFVALHGELLSDLGYITIQERENALIRLDKTEKQLLYLAYKGFTDRNSIRFDAFSKEKVIQQLLDRPIVGHQILDRKNWLKTIFKSKK